MPVNATVYSSACKLGLKEQAGVTPSKCEEEV